MTVRQWIVLAAVVLWAALALAWYAGAAVLDSDGPLDWAAFLLAILPLFVAYEALTAAARRLRDWRLRQRGDDA